MTRLTAGDANRGRPEQSERRCVLSRSSGPRERMIRLVRAPDGGIVPDIDENLPGRGVWIQTDRSALETAIGKGKAADAISRGLKTRVSPTQISADLPVRIDALLLERVRNRLGLERRAGRLVAGFEKVRQALRTRRVRVLLEASDGEHDGCRKLRALAAPDVVVAEALTRDQMSLALGRGNVVHAAVEHGGGAERLIREIDRLVAWRNASASRPLQNRGGSKATERRENILGLQA